MYERHGFWFTPIHADPKFNCIRDDVLLFHLHTTLVNEHVGEVDMSIVL